jgi:cell division transport system permease protein
LNSVDANGDIVRRSFGRPANRVAFLMLALLVAFLLSMIAMAGASAERLSSSLEPRLSGEVTIAVWGRGLESADAAVARAAELLTTQAGVRHATILEADESDATVGKLIAGRSQGLEGPRLLSLSGSPGAIPAAPDLDRVLKANRLVTAIDDHRLRGPLETRALLAGGLAIALALTLCGALFAVSMMNGLGVVASSRARFELMTCLGAKPGFIGATVGRGLGLMALIGGVIGVLCANLMVLAAHGLWWSLALPAVARATPRDSVWTAAWPFAVTAIAAIGGGLGARHAIVVRERRL